MRLLGAHMSIAGGVDKAIGRGLAIGCTAIQIFVKNNNQWSSKPLEQNEINRFLAARQESRLFVFAHAGYLINLATSDPVNRQKSIDSMLDELARSAQLQLPFIVLHPGSFLTQTTEAGIKSVAANLDHLLARTVKSKVKIALETTAGQGTNLGQTFAELARIINLCQHQDRLAVCFDTCHAFAAGYDLKTPAGYKKCWEEFDRLIGLNKLAAIHLNDSKGALGSHKDRHEHIGQGSLGLAAFKQLLNDQRFTSLPMVLETPKDPDQDQDKKNLQLLASLFET